MEKRTNQTGTEWMICQEIPPDDMPKLRERYAKVYGQ